MRWKRRCPSHHANGADGRVYRWFADDTSAQRVTGQISHRSNYAVAWWGGVIRIGPHTLSIPAGALDAAVTITATAPSDNVNRVRFQPEGLVFRRSAALTMSYANCNLLGTLLPKRIAYTSDALSIVSYVLSLDNLFTKYVTGRLNHFSNYAIAW